MGIFELHNSEAGKTRRECVQFYVESQVGFAEDSYPRTKYPFIPPWFEIILRIILKTKLFTEKIP